MAYQGQGNDSKKSFAKMPHSEQLSRRLSFHGAGDSTKVSRRTSCVPEVRSVNEQWRLKPMALY